MKQNARKASAQSKDTSNSYGVSNRVFLVHSICSNGPEEKKSEQDKQTNESERINQNCSKKNILDTHK
jgi:hypothetical protein